MNLDDELINQRVDMHIIPGEVVSKDQYLEILKSDWNERGKRNPDLYVWAGKERDVESFMWSGKHDFDTYFKPAYEQNSIRADTILEIGCGMGRMTQFIYPYVNPSTYYALDISPSLLERAELLLPIDKYSALRFITGGGNKIPIPDNSVDFAFEYIVFQHIPYAEIIDDYIHEIDRTLKKGGTFVGHFRDVGETSKEFTDSNTWHGCRYGSSRLYEIILDTALSVKRVTGAGTDNCWIHLLKK
jgi:SAM-dependent methyltransferase